MTLPDGRQMTALLIALAIIVVVAGGLGIFYFTKSATTISPPGNKPGSVVNTGNANDNPYPPHGGTLILNNVLQDSTHSSWQERAIHSAPASSFREPTMSA